MQLNTIHNGDCVEVMATLPDCSVDAVVCDPPYGLEFMGKEWDKLGAKITDKETAKKWHGNMLDGSRGSLPYGSGNRLHGQGMG